MVSHLYEFQYRTYHEKDNERKTCSKEILTLLGLHDDWKAAVVFDAQQNQLECMKNSILRLKSKLSGCIFSISVSVFRLSQCEDDKVTKESQIRSLKEELRGQEDMVAKLIKEKRTWADDR